MEDLNDGKLKHYLFDKWFSVRLNGADGKTTVALGI